MRDIISVAEKMYPNTLTDYQKKILLMFQDAKNKNETLIINYPARCGRTMIYNVLKEWL